MRTPIKRKLLDIEQQHNIQILLAVESGSRAWGFESVNSDWDVRFIYVHAPEWYLRIQPQRNVIEYPIESTAHGELDINGWELRKSLQLMQKSNPTLLEWLDSPLVYQEATDCMQEYRQLAKGFFNPHDCFHHYLHMALNQYRELIGKDQVKLKKYLYMLRPILACLWLERNYGPVPMRFQTLLESIIETSELRRAIDQLITDKKQGTELGLGLPITIIDNFLTEAVNRLKEVEILSPQLPLPILQQADKYFFNTVMNLPIG